MRWTVHLEGGPRRVNHAAVVINERIFSFGGYCTGEDYENTRPMDVHIFNTVSLRWSLLPLEKDQRSTPYQRYGHTAVEYENNAYIWGGRNDSMGACNKLFRFNGVTLNWDRPKVYGHIPDARDGHSACIVNGCMYIFAGYEEFMDRFSNDLKYLDLRTFTWFNLIAKGMPARWRDFHTSTTVGDTIYIFGGRCDEGGNIFTNKELYCNKLVAFNTSTNSWFQPSIPLAGAPSGRRSHSAFLYNGFIYIFGGFNGKTGVHFNDLYRLNLAPSLKTLASIVIIENKLSWTNLPHDVRWDLKAMTTDNTISRMNVTNG